MTENVMDLKDIMFRSQQAISGQKHASSDIKSSDITRVDDLEMSAVGEHLRNSSLYESMQERYTIIVFTINGQFQPRENLKNVRKISRKSVQNRRERQTSPFTHHFVDE